MTKNTTAKEGDLCTTPLGEFRVVRPDRTYCSACDHPRGGCGGIECGGSYGIHGFILLTEINYLTYRLTK